MSHARQYNPPCSPIVCWSTMHFVTASSSAGLDLSITKKLRIGSDDPRQTLLITLHSYEDSVASQCIVRPRHDDGRRLDHNVPCTVSGNRVPNENLPRPPSHTPSQQTHSPRDPILRSNNTCATLLLVKAVPFPADLLACFTILDPVGPIISRISINPASRR